MHSMHLTTLASNLGRAAGASPSIMTPLDRCPRCPLARRRDHLSRSMLTLAILSKRAIGSPTSNSTGLTLYICFRPVSGCTALEHQAMHTLAAEEDNIQCLEQGDSMLMICFSRDFRKVAVRFIARMPLSHIIYQS